MKLWTAEVLWRVENFPLMESWNKSLQVIKRSETGGTPRAGPDLLPHPVASSTCWHASSSKGILHLPLVCLVLASHKTNHLFWTTWVILAICLRKYKIMMSITVPENKPYLWATRRLIPQPTPALLSSHAPLLWGPSSHNPGELTWNFQEGRLFLQ